MALPSANSYPNINLAIAKQQVDGHCVRAEPLGGEINVRHANDGNPMMVSGGRVLFLPLTV